MGFAKRLLLQLLYITLALPCSAQHPVFQSYTVSDGLSNNAIRKIYQDSLGYIWIATWEGLNKYDGHKFTRFATTNGLPHGMINDVYEAGDGEMMVVMNDGHISTIKKGRLDPSPRRSPFIVNQLFNDPLQGLLGVSDKFGLLKWGKSGFERTDGTDNFSLYEIIGWQDHFLAVGDPSPVNVYNNKLKKIGQSAPAPILTHCIFRDRQNRVWLGTSGGLKLVDLTNIRAPRVLPAPSPFDHPLLRKSEVTAIYQDHAGHLWFGTHDGIVRVAENGNARVYTEKDGLPGVRITYISSDREKNLWVGTYSGLAKLPYQSVDVVAAAAGSFFRTPLFEVRFLTDSQLAVTALDAVYKFHTGRLQAQPLLPLVPGDVAAPVSGSEPFAVIYKNRVYTLNRQQTAMEPGPIFPTLYIFSAAQWGKMICAGHNGVSILFDNGKVVRVLDSIRMNNVTWDRKGRIWAGTWAHGVFRLTVDSQLRVVKHIEHIRQVPAAEEIRSLMEDSRGKMWIGTRYHGIIVLNERSDGGYDSVRIDQSNGLMSDWIHSFAEAPDGNIWTGTLAGITKIIPTYSGYRVFNFSRAVNFYSAANSLAVSAENQFWGTSDRGLFTFRDLQLERFGPLPVYFTDIRLGTSDSNFAVAAPGRKMRLKFNENYLRFVFTSPGFLNEKDLTYSYRLRGSGDTSWSQPSNLHTVEYASLNAGHYIFEVKMKGWNGEYGPVSAFSFIINRPFWQSWWFYLAVSLAAILVALSVFRYRTQQLLKVQRVRTAIATDLHDDIGSSLTNISILSELSLDKLHKPELAGDFISRIRNEVQHSSQALDDIIWSVNARNDSLAETLARMRRFAGDIFDNSSTRCHLRIDDDFADRKLNMALRRDLYLIYKETITNISKHARAGNVWVNISGDENQIHLDVKDDGSGFDPHGATQRNGLKNLRYRVEKWKGRLDIQSQPGSGTQLSLTLDLRE